MKFRAVPFLRALLALLFLVHAVQIWGPLRLNTDAEKFLTSAATAADTQLAFPIASSQPHPPGYATLLACLDRGGLGSAPIFVLANLVFMAVGIFAAHGVLKRGLGFNEEAALTVCSMTLLSFVVVKHAPIPLSDIPFFGLAMAALYTLVRAEAALKLRGVWLTGALLLCAGAIMFRIIGVALLPALVWAACGKRKQLATGLLLVGGVLGVLAMSRSAYANYAVRHFDGGDAWGTIGAARLREFGELALNFPASRLPESLTPLLWVAGGALFCAVIAGLALWKSGGTVELFLIAFAGTLSVWPFEDARFWLPAVSLLIAVAWVGLNELPKSFVAIWGGSYAVAGVAALAFSTSLSLSGAGFSERYGDGTQKAAYRAALQNEAVSSETDAGMVAILRRFEPRARDVTVVKR